MRIADRRVASALDLVNSETSDPNITFPHFDMKLNANGPDMEIKLVRGKVIEKFSHEEIVNACWESVLDFSFDVQPRLKGLVENEVSLLCMIKNLLSTNLTCSFYIYSITEIDDFG